MRRRATLVVLALFVAACAPQTGLPTPSPTSSPAATEPSSTTTPPAATPSASPSGTASPTGPQASVVEFANADHGWLGVEDGILGSDDGGRSWSRQLTAARVLKIWSYDATRAWALAADNTVYRTRDGAHWTGVSRTSPPIAEIDPFSPDLVWAIGVAPTSGPAPQLQIGNVLVSDDGGFIWRPIGTHTMWSVCFSSPVDGFGAEGKQIFRTGDAGRTWTPIATLPINDEGPWYPTLTCPGGSSFRVQVTEPYAALSHVPYLVFRTTDAGRRWELEYREGYTLGSTTPQNASGLGSYPSIIGTFADGDTWLLTCSPPADVQDFLVIDAAGTVIKREKAPFVACARGADFVDAQRGWAIDIDYHLNGTQLESQARLMRTIDGSRSWQGVYPP